MKPTPDGHSCHNCWRFLCPLALPVHSIALFTSYFDRKDVLALPLCRIWRSIEPSFTIAVLLTALSPFQISFCRETRLSQPRTWPLSFYFTFLHLPDCSSQASWTNTSERDRWDTIIMRSIKNYLCTDYGEKSYCCVMATVDSMAVEVQSVEGKSFFIQREIMLQNWLYSSTVDRPVLSPSPSLYIISVTYNIKGL